jgi:hypothetical protein
MLVGEGKRGQEKEEDIVGRRRRRRGGEKAGEAEREAERVGEGEGEGNERISMAKHRITHFIYPVNMSDQSSN